MLKIPYETQPEIHKWFLDFKPDWSCGREPLTRENMTRLGYWKSSTDLDGWFINKGHREEFCSLLGYAWKYWVIPEVNRLFDEGVCLPNEIYRILLTGVNGEMRIAFNQEYDNDEATPPPFFLIIFNYDQKTVEFNLYGFFPENAQKTIYSLSDLWDKDR